jgi:hypothetical protein
MRLKGSLGAKAVLSIDIARFPGKRHGRLGCMPGFLQNSVDIFYGIPGPREAVCSRRIPELCIQNKNTQHKDGHASGDGNKCIAHLSVHGMSH